MGIYVLLVALVVITSLFMRGNREGSKKYVIVASLLLFAVYGLRNTYVIGVDSTGSYLHGFRQMPGYSYAELLEQHTFNAGFYLMEKFLYEVFAGDYQLYITTISAFVTFCFGRLIYKYSPSPVQSILYHFGLLLFIFHFSALKQSIAMAILMLAFESLVARKPIRFLFLVLLAGQFHFPAMILLPAYPIPRLKLGRYYLLALMLLLGLTYLLRDEIITFMYNLYNDEQIDTINLDNVQFFRTKAVIMIVIIVAAVLFRKPRAEDPVYNTLLEFMGIAVVFQTFCGYNNTFERLADYYFQFSVIFIPMVFDKYADREPLFGWRLMGVIDTIAPTLFCGFGIYRFLSFVADNRFYTPYRFFFQ